MPPNDFLQDLIQGRGRNLALIRERHVTSGCHHLLDSIPAHGRDENQRSKVNEHKLRVDVLAVALAVLSFLGKQIPLVDSQDQSLPALGSIGQDLRILVGNSFHAIQHMDNEIRSIHRGERSGDAVMLDSLYDSRLAPYPGGVDQSIELASEDERSVYGVAGCSRRSIDDRALVAEKTID